MFFLYAVYVLVVSCFLLHLSPGETASKTILKFIYVIYFELILHKIIVSCILLQSYIRSFLTVLPSMYFSVDSASEMKYDLVMDLSWARVLLDPFILFNILHEAPEVTIEKKRCS